MPGTQPQGTHAFNPASSSAQSAMQILNAVNTEEEGQRIKLILCQILTLLSFHQILSFLHLLSYHHPFFYQIPACPLLLVTQSLHHLCLCLQQSIQPCSSKQSLMSKTDDLNPVIITTALNSTLPSSILLLRSLNLYLH